MKSSGIRPSLETGISPGLMGTPYPPQESASLTTESRGSRCFGASRRPAYSQEELRTAD